MAGGVQDIDRGWRRIVRRMARVGTKGVTIGVHADDEGRQTGRGDTSINNVGLAVVHEFGATIRTGTATIRIPERSFLRAAFDENRSKYLRMLRLLTRRVAGGQLTVDQMLGQIGEVAKADVERLIAAGVPPDIKESTKRRKGSSVPLIDTGQLRQAIQWEIDR